VTVRTSADSSATSVSCDRRREWTYATVAVLCALAGYFTAIGTREAPSDEANAALLPAMGTVGTLLVGASAASAWWLARSRARALRLAEAAIRELRAAQADVESARLEAERLVRETSGSDETLRLERGRLDLALSGGGLGLWDWNPKTGDLVLDDRWARLLGYEVHDLETSTSAWSDLVHPDDLPLAFERISTCLNGEATPYEISHRMRHRDGRWRWITARGRVVDRDADGAVTRMVGTHQDVTERMESESRLAESETRFRDIADAAPIVMFTCGPDRPVRLRQPALARPHRDDPRAEPRDRLVASDRTRGPRCVPRHVQDRTVPGTTPTLSPGR